MATPPSKPAHLSPSELGTKEYWDSLYTRELSNHISDPSDEGTIWFDDSSAEDKMVSFLRSGAAGDLSSASFLDVGTGNGHLLFRLREEEDDEGERAFRGRMVGADYSVKAVEFARRIAVERGGEEGEVEFVVWDVLGGKEAVMSGQGEGWDVVLDKGTFDAISLSEERDARGRRVVEGYKEGVVGVMREGGLLLVTSCNWTEVELRAWFEDADAGEGQGEVGLRYEKSIEYRSFSFGGKKGQTISSCCFRKVRL